MRPSILLAAALSFAVVAPAFGQAATDVVPIADFAKRPKYSQVRFSPDGGRFAALQEIDGRANLTVGDLKARTLTRVTSFSTYDVHDYEWISNTRLVMRLYDAQKGLAEFRGGGLFALNHDGSQPRELSPVLAKCEAQIQICRQIRFERRIPGSEDEIIAIANERDLRTDDVYRLNTRTGRKTLLSEDNPGKVSAWFLDAANVPRAAWASDDATTTETFWYRDRADAKWTKVASYTGIGTRRMRPAAFDADGSLLVYSNLESDAFRLQEFDPKTGKVGAVVVELPSIDIDWNQASVIRHATTNRILGVRIAGEKPQAVWFDERYAKMQALLDVSLPKGNVNQFRILDDERVSIVSSSDRDPGQYLLYDPAAKQLQEVLRPRDWIKPEQMAAMTTIRYKARDGVEIPAYLSLPAGRPATKLPLVAMIHGGPFGVRDHWGFDPDVQFLASRGYAVLQPNFRGSGGFGQKHYTSGFKQWGLAMQDDITDGVRHLIERGVVDPGRVCIQGTSYGGYATLMALVKEPDLFKCGINEAGVSDLFWLSELGYTDFNQADAAASELFFKTTVGESGKDRQALEAASPRLHAGKIKAPLMIVHAVRDQRVPIRHAEGMRDAMRSAGKEVEWVVYPDEGHGFVKLENRVDRYRRIEAFLARHLGR